MAEARQPRAVRARSRGTISRAGRTPDKLQRVPSLMSNEHHKRSPPVIHCSRHDFTALRARLAAKQGREYWRSFEEIGEDKSFQEFLHREFPPGISEWPDEVSRRHFLM